jgi:nucleoid DNA-binding protein
MQPSDCKKIVKSFFNALTDHLSKGGDIELRRFGRFFISRTGPRRIRNPRNGEVFSDGVVSAVRFRTGKPLNAALNGP